MAHYTRTDDVVQLAWWDRRRDSSEWVVMARTEADLEPLRQRNPRWHSIRAGGPVWTDTYSSLFGVLHLG